MTQGTHTLTVTDDTFTRTIEDHAGLAIVDFTAAWCGPCRIVGPIVDQLAEEYSGQGVVVGKMDVDQNLGTTGRFGIRSIPSILFFRNGIHVDTVVGAVPKQHLARKIAEHLG